MKNSLKEPLRITMAAVHLEEGPHAVPLGAASVAAALRAAFPVGLDLSLVEGFASDSAGSLAGKVTEKNPQAAGFSLYSWNRGLILEAAKRLRRERPGIFLFCGGPEATAQTGGLPASQGGPFDAVIRGEGEEAAVRLVGERFLGTAGQGGGDPTLPALSGGKARLSCLPSPWLDGTLTVRGRSGALWELARGCPYSCAYCYESKGGGEAAGGKRVRYFSGDRIREELRLFVKEKIPYIFVLDPTFNIDNKRALDILDMIILEIGGRKDIHWHFEIRAELLTREQARRFAALGASLQIGLQTADPRIAALAGRGLDRGLFASRIQMLNREGLSFGLDLIYGLPGDTLAGYRRSLDFALSLYPNNLDMFRLSVLPGTVFADRAEELGLRSDTAAPYELRSTPDFPAGDLALAERLSQAADVFYNRGRAVGWFNQALYPLKTKASAFLAGFADYLDKSDYPLREESPALRAGSRTIEKLQLGYLESRYKAAKQGALLPALGDLVRRHGEWNRALAGERLIP
jgi:radical SAM superfamily enzyme YgiQ (UPF0313 family)